MKKFHPLLASALIITVGISAVGLMTLVQVGLGDFQNAKGVAEKPRGLLAKSPDRIVKERAKDDSQGIFGFLKTIDKKFTVNTNHATTT